MLPGGAVVSFDLSKGFPAVTTKKLMFNSVVAELIGFLKGETNAYKFKELGTSIWIANAEAETWKATKTFKDKGEEGYLGRIYGAQWRDWKNSHGESLDQLKALFNLARKDPTSRRLLVTAWRPDEISEMALPPCHVMWGITIRQEAGKIDLWWIQRSCDVFLGLPFNIASYAVLTHLLSQSLGYSPGLLTGHLIDVHLYEDHIEPAKILLSREPRALPRLDITPWIGEIEVLSGNMSVNDFFLEGYNPHPAIMANMAV